jgi:hypothetical protein
MGAHFARGCSVVLSVDLYRLAKPLVGEVVVTILTSEGSQVRNLLRPLPGQRVAGKQRRGLGRVSTS